MLSHPYTHHVEMILVMRILVVSQEISTELVLLPVIGSRISELIVAVFTSGCNIPERTIALNIRDQLCPDQMLPTAKLNHDPVDDDQELFGISELVRYLSQGERLSNMDTFPVSGHLPENAMVYQI